jgi:hypothetical protein
MVSAAAAMWAALPSWDGHEGPRARIEISPGTVAITRRDLARRERTLQRQAGRHTKVVDQLAEWVNARRACVARQMYIWSRWRLPDRLELAGWLLGITRWPLPPTPRRAITEWSRKSQTNMLRTFHQLDYTPWLRLIERCGRTPVMVTLTYPGDWEVVAPTGAHSKRHLKMFRSAWAKAWGEAPIALWKLELQRRGAPHYHLFMARPNGVSGGRYYGLRFEAWLSQVWAGIVEHPDPEQRRRHLAAGTRVDPSDALRCKDPRRLAVYFTAHGKASAGKAYQHIVPELWTESGCGPGRFWGYWTLHKRVHGVELPAREADWSQRLIRRWWHAKGLRVQRMAPRRAPPRPVTYDIVGLAAVAYLGAYPEAPRHRRVTRRSERMKGGVGWVAHNTGPGFAATLARAVEQLTGLGAS